MTIDSVYGAVDGRIAKNRRFDRNKLIESQTHRLGHVSGRIEAHIDPEASDIDEMIPIKGTVIPPDEVLDTKKTGTLKIPVKTREDFANEKAKLPDSDLLKALHFYASRKFSNDDGVSHRFDEGALLAMGLMVESWVKQMVDDSLVEEMAEKIEGEEDEKMMKSHAAGTEESGSSVPVSDDSSVEIEDISIG